MFLEERSSEQRLKEAWHETSSEIRTSQGRATLLMVHLGTDLAWPGFGAGSTGYQSVGEAATDPGQAYCFLASTGQRSPFTAASLGKARAIW